MKTIEVAVRVPDDADVDRIQTELLRECHEVLEGHELLLDSEVESEVYVPL